MKQLDILLRQLTKKQHKLRALSPMAHDQQAHLEEWLKVELTYSSNAIEGNTLTRIETAEVIEKGVGAVISNKPLKDQLEAINHAKAIDFVRELARKRKGHQYITEQDILTIQQALLASIHDDWAGVYRKIEIFVRGSNTDFPPPMEVPVLMKRFTTWLSEQQGEHPVILAADTHFKLASIHPFRDGNGRTARLLMNLILLIHGYPMAIIRNEQRIEYLELFDKVRKTDDMQPFYEFVIQAVGRSLDVYLNAAKEKQITSLRIGELANKTGISEHTIRFWTNEGLIKAERTTGNYRLYDSSTITVIREIQRLKKELRLTLPEIKERLRK
ncbi:Fic family protein [Patescibacteria group bacterium]|nr:Fic family protein [Patescibacteria group bacterium]MBU4016883.1 Fic family protein [Patescibacteria group bacterium]MBU4098903.1 Fic family protein [Patescibacteria group bacterium]